MKHLLLLAVLPWLTGCPRMQEQEAVPLIHFQEANFGVRFSHTASLSTEYNPHGGANLVLISWKGDPIGGLKVAPLPPEVGEEVFIAAGKQHYREKYNASSVIYRLYRNQHGYSFHHIKAEASLDGKAYVLNRFVHLERPTAARSNLPSLDDLFGAFSFEFVCRKEDSESVGQETMRVIDSFRIEKTADQEVPQANPTSRPK